MLIAGAHHRFVREHNDRMGLAWHAATLNAYAHHDPKKMPKLDTLMHSDSPIKARKQSATEQIAVLKGIFSGRRR